MVLYTAISYLSYKRAVSSWSRDNWWRFSEVVDTATLLMKELKLKGILQVSNMRIPMLFNRRYGVDLELLYETNIEKI